MNAQIDLEQLQKSFINSKRTLKQLSMDSGLSVIQLWQITDGLPELQKLDEQQRKRLWDASMWPAS